MHNLLRYEFDLEFDLPVGYPATPPELALPELDGKTEKMYRGGKICLDSHFRSFGLLVVYDAFERIDTTTPVLRKLVLRLRYHVMALQVPESDSLATRLMCACRPLWARNVPHFGIAHAMALGVSSIAMARMKPYCSGFPGLGKLVLPY